METILLVEDSDEDELALRQFDVRGVYGLARLLA